MRAESDGADFVFGLTSIRRSMLLMAQTAGNLRFQLMSNQAKLRTHAIFLYQSGSWDRPRKVVARLEGRAGVRHAVSLLPGRANA